MSFWDLVWLLLLTYLFVTYLMLLFTVLGDLFRDEETGGFAKAAWVVLLIVLPFITLLAYLLIRGRDMGRRAAATASRDRAAAEAYLRDVAGTTSPAQQVSEAKALLDGNVITAQEYETLKAKALAG